MAGGTGEPTETLPLEGAPR